MKICFPESIETNVFKLPQLLAKQLFSKEAYIVVLEMYPNISPLVLLLQFFFNQLICLEGVYQYFAFCISFSRSELASWYHLMGVHTGLYDQLFGRPAILFLASSFSKSQLCL